MNRNEMAVQKRLQEMNEMDQMKRALERLESETAALKKRLQEKQAESLDEMTMSFSTSYDKTEYLETKRKLKIAVCEREHREAGDVTEMKKELETLRHQHVKHSASPRDLAMLRIISTSQLNKKAQALRRVASLEDKIAALRQISEETQQRQLSELQPSSSDISRRQQQQQRTGKANELMPIFRSPL